MKEFPLNWSRTSSRKIYKRIPFDFDLSSFYKGFPWEIFFLRKSFVKFFWNFKLESDFSPHFFAKSEKSKIAHIYLSWTTTEPIFSEIGDKKILHFHFHFFSLFSLSLFTINFCRVVPRTSLSTINLTGVDPVCRLRTTTYYVSTRTGWGSRS